VMCRTVWRLRRIAFTGRRMRQRGGTTRGPCALGRLRVPSTPPTS
jgi:hypothetical protein